MKNKKILDKHYVWLHFGLCLTHVALYLSFLSDRSCWLLLGGPWWDPILEGGSVRIGVGTRLLVPCPGGLQSRHE